MKELKSVCIEDFCGSWRGIPVSFWADYFPELSTTYFGGDWSFVPPMFSSDEPTNENVNRWANYHEAMM